MAHETPVVKKLPNGTRLLPDSTKVREINLPDYLKEDNLGAGVSIAEVNALLAQTRADVLAQVNAMLQNLPEPQTAFIYSTSTPVTAVTVQHNLGRRTVAVTVYSLDYQTQYEFAEVYPQNDNSAILAFAEPLAFIAIFS